MAAEKNWYLVTYDVMDPKRLKKVAKKLQGYGRRLQYSVFRCRMNDRERERLAWEMKKIMETEDKLLIVGLCGKCAGKVHRINDQPNWPEDPPNFEVV